MSTPTNDPSPTGELTRPTALVSRTLERALGVSRRRERLSKLIDRMKARVEAHQQARLTIGVLIAGGFLAAALKPGLNIAPLILSILVPPFIWLVILTRNRTRFLTKLERWREFLDRQERRLKGLPSSRSTVDVLPGPDSEFVAHDLGLFGSHSLWGLIDETITEGGRRELVRTMLSMPPGRDAIVNRQETIRRLRGERWFYSKLTLERGADEPFTFSANEAKTILATPFVPRYFGWGVSFIVLFNLLAWYFVATKGDTGAGASLPLVFAILHFLLIHQAGPVFERGLGLSHHLGQLAPIFAALEKRAKRSERIRELCPTTSIAGPARESKRVDRLLAVLGVKTNPVLHLLLNALLPWSSVGSWLLERRRSRIFESFPICLGELAQVEALGSIVIFDHYQTSNYPSLDAKALSFEGLFHPLIEREAVVANDFSFGTTHSLGLLTGSNMSGKSTFLRAVGLNQILANMGAPVFAEKFSTKPMAVETCIEVSDSLRDGVSYFYAEVRRLKALIDHAKRGNGILYLIDEIFRGTNNRERHIGSRAVVRALARADGSQGFVSTHDLELTALAEQESAVANLHFRETVENGKMAFSYRLHPGPSPTTNALRIMEMEGLPVDSSH